MEFLTIFQSCELFICRTINASILEWADEAESMYAARAYAHIFLMFLSAQAHTIHLFSSETKALFESTEGESEKDEIN